MRREHPDRTPGAGSAPRIGVLAVQGGFAAHCRRLAAAGADPVEVRLPADLQGLDGLILPGGESTTIMQGIATAGLADGIHALRESGRPLLGTCAGMILAGRDHLGLIDIETRRNAFGRQLASFEQDLPLAMLGESPFRGVFIRAPWIEAWGEGVEILGRIGDHPVAAQAGAVTVLSFHPELTGDLRVHRWFSAACS